MLFRTIFVASSEVNACMAEAQWEYLAWTPQKWPVAPEALNLPPSCDRIAGRSCKKWISKALDKTHIWSRPASWLGTYTYRVMPCRPSRRRISEVLLCSCSTAVVQALNTTHIFIKAMSSPPKFARWAPSSRFARLSARHVGVCCTSRGPEAS